MDIKTKGHMMSEKLFIQDGEKKREFTEAEYAQHELDKTEAQTKADQLAAKAVEKAALLDRLGLTADEAALLLL
jgi:predicted Ser/Thr protein kinase